MNKASTAYKIHGVGRRKSAVARVWLKPEPANLKSMAKSVLNTLKHRCALHSRFPI